MNKELDKDLQHIVGDGDALGLAGAVEAEVHEEGGGVLEAVHADLAAGEVLRHQPGDQAPLKQRPPDTQPDTGTSVTSANTTLDIR